MDVDRRKIYYVLLVLSFCFPIFKSQFGLVIDFVWFLSFIFLIFIQLAFKDFIVNLNTICFLLIIAIISIVSIYFNEFSYFLFIKSYLPVLVICLISCSIFYKYGTEGFFYVYLKASFYLSMFGILQFILSLIGIDLLLNVWGRLNSTFPEGSHFASAIIPAVVYFILKKKYNFESIVVFFAYFLTFSTTSYLVLLLLLIPYKVSLRNVREVFSIFILFGSAFCLYYFIGEVSYRVDDVISSYHNYDLTSVNLTTFSFYSNLEVALSSLDRHFPFGAGMGNHYSEYQYFIDYINSDFKSLRAVGINQESGHSLIIRVLSEFGFLGLLCVFFYFLYVFIKIFINGENKVSEDKLIAYSCFSTLLFRIFKLGGYIDYGLIIFVCCSLITLQLGKKKLCS